MCSEVHGAELTVVIVSHRHSVLVTVLKVIISSLLSLYLSFKNLSFHKPQGVASPVSSKTREATPTRIGVHACDINPYLHEFFELILID